MTTLWVGFGNPLRRDDGVGPRAAEMLAAEGLAARAVFQPVPELALELVAVRRVVFLDADLSSAPGALTQRRLAPARRPQAGHRLDPRGLLSLAARLGPECPEAWLLSIGILDVGVGEGFSIPVAASFGEFLERARALALDPPHADHGSTSSA